MCGPTLVLALALLGAPSVHAEEPPSTEAAAATHDLTTILRGLEKNLSFESRKTTLKMVVANARRTREFEMISYGRGSDEASIEYLSPARDKGTRMLRKGSEIWMYMPSVERTQKISGHMLRQGMSGSDMSYEDMTTATEWEDVYNGEILGTEPLNGQEHYKVELKAKDDSVSYPRRLVWVDRSTLIPTRQELYALSGMMVKTWEMTDVRPVEGDRVYPFKMRLEDALKEGSYTEIITIELKVGVELPGEVFSRGWIERG